MMKNSRNQSEKLATSKPLVKKKSIKGTRHLMRQIFFGIVFFLWISCDLAFAGGAVVQRQKMMQNVRVHQQVSVQQAAVQQVAVQQAAAQQAAAQAAMMAQYQAQQVAAQTAAIQQHVVAQTAAEQIAVQRHVQQQAAQDALQAGLRQKMAEDANFRDSQATETATLDDVIKALDNSGKDWNLIVDPEAKAAVIEHYIGQYQQQGVMIRKPASAYVQIIDSMTDQSPQMLERPFPQILETAAVVEYDLDNGHDKNAMARKILGSDQAFMANKQRLGIK